MIMILYHHRQFIIIKYSDGLWLEESERNLTKYIFKNILLTVHNKKPKNRRILISAL